MTEYRVVARKSFYNIRKYIGAYGCLSKKRKKKYQQCVKILLLMIFYVTCQKQGCRCCYLVSEHKILRHDVDE